MTEQQAIEKLVSWCNGEVGYHEGSGNWNKYSENPDVIKLLGWKPQNEAWCDTFTDAAFCINFGLKAASEMTYQPIGKGSAACRTSAQFFKDHAAFFYRPQVGDVIFFISGGAINHQGIVTAINGNSITTVEGNSSDAVSRRNYTIGDSRIAGYGRPKWSVVADDEGNQSEKPTDSEIPVVDAPVEVVYNIKLPLVVYGDEGVIVRNAQLLLIGNGYKCGWWGADGEFGDATLAAVKKFQSAFGITVDGEIGGETWNALFGIHI